MSESKEIVNWEEKLKEEAKQVAALERPSITGVSIRSGILSINDQPVPGNKLSCVVIAAAFEHVLYRSPFDPGRIVPPDCFSLSLDGENMMRHEVVEDEDYGPECAKCEMFQWSSIAKIDPSKAGKKGKACKERRRLMLIPADSIKSGEIMKAEMALMSIPVTSIGNWGRYVNATAAEYGRPYWSMLTEVSVHPHIKNQLEVKFASQGVIKDDYLGELSAKAQEAIKVIMQPYDMTPAAEQQAPTAQTGRKY